LRILVENPQFLTPPPPGENWQKQKRKTGEKNPGGGGGRDLSKIMLQMYSVVKEGRYEAEPARVNSPANKGQQSEEFHHCIRDRCVLLRKYAVTEVPKHGKNFHTYDLVTCTDSQ